MIDGDFFGQDGEHRRQSRSGLRAEGGFAGGVAEPGVSEKDPRGEEDGEELGFQAEPGERVWAGDRDR